MPKPVLRAYQPADLEPMVRLFRASVHQVGGADYSPAQLAAWAPPAFDSSRWPDRLASQTVLVAECSGTLVGFCSWTGDGYLDLLYVHPDHVRRGVATALCATAEQTLRDRGVRRFHTQASITAQPFFLHHGFRLLRHQTVHVRGVDLPNAIMEKLLD